MKYEVSKTAIQGATRCKCDNACLSGSGVCTCKVESAVGDKYLFVKRTNGNDCSYAIPFGWKSFVCTCPVRYELHKKYGDDFS